MFHQKCQNFCIFAVVSSYSGCVGGFRVHSLQLTYILVGRLTLKVCSWLFHVDVVAFFFLLLVSFSFPSFFMCFKLTYLAFFFWFRRGSDFKSTHFRTEHQRTNKLYDTLQICAKQIGWSGVLCGIQCGKLCEYVRGGPFQTAHCQMWNWIIKW